MHKMKYLEIKIKKWNKQTLHFIYLYYYLFLKMFFQHSNFLFFFFLYFQSLWVSLIYSSFSVQLDYILQRRSCIALTVLHESVFSV